MSLNADDVRRLAVLARLDITDDEVDQTLSELNEVFGLIEQMRSTDTSGIEPMTHPHSQGLRLRDDEVSETDHREAYLALAPEQQDGLFLVPKVIE